MEGDIYIARWGVLMTKTSPPIFKVVKYKDGEQVQDNYYDSRVSHFNNLNEAKLEADIRNINDVDPMGRYYKGDVV